MRTTLNQLTLLASILLLSACGTTPPTHYYVLSSDLMANAALANEARPSDITSSYHSSTPRPNQSVLLGVGPITVADYLSRIQITLNIGNTLEVDPFHHWGEPLSAGITRVLYENLAAKLGQQHLVQFPWRSDEIPDWQLRVHVAQLNRSGATALIKAHWTLASMSGSKTTRREIFRAQIPVRDDSYEALATAYSELLHQLSEHIVKYAPKPATRP
jgi:uncharacterized lipoprotein YmbA